MKIKKQHQLSCMLFSQLCLMFYQGQHPQMVEWDLFKLTLHEEVGYKISPSRYICSQTFFVWLTNWLTVFSITFFAFPLGCCVLHVWTMWCSVGTWMYLNFGLHAQPSILYLKHTEQLQGLGGGGCSQWAASQQRLSAHCCSQKKRTELGLVKTRTAMPGLSSPLQLRCWHAGCGRKPFVVKARLVGKLLSAYQPSCVQCWYWCTLPAYPISKGWEQSSKEHRGGQ